MSVFHSAKTDVWGTPPELVKHARLTMGWINCDPASDATWNARIAAARYIDVAQDGTKTPWMIGGPKPAEAADIDCTDKARQYHVFCNPPGDPRGELVAKYWCALAGYLATGWVTAAVWVGFSVEQLARLQRVGALSHPLDHTTLILAARPRFLRDYETPGDAPSHAGYVTLAFGCVRLMPERERAAMRARFLETDLGCVVEPATHLAF